ncbi:uncharacterized protein [Sinocyclocheilus grahami]|uniref:uncharacterized protein n=1 Tax=Sinocyclocheilus grahami TaxID=75366 RepID=UPI0007ACD47E|nr:PREDICTED: uncharacterized protein LOC107567238 [Sinocyclocheilus grahami]
MSTGQKITNLEVSTTPLQEEQFRKQLYQKIEVNLNEGIKEPKPQVFLWYKKDPQIQPITRIEFSFNNDMKTGLVDAEYTQIDKDLNAGVSGDHIFLWYFRGSTPNDNPIISLKVTKDAKEEPALLLEGWERLGCDLNRNAGGNVIYLWVKRERLNYISEVTASVDFYADKHLFELGFTRVDEDTNRDARGYQIFIWYRRTTDISKALTALDVSTSPREESSLKAKGFRKVNADLNKGTSGDSVYLWYKGKCDAQIKTMVLLVNPQAWDEYAKAGIVVINKNLNSGNKGREMYLAYK